ncbi:MAG TPA: aspartyl protease family protein [Verrucomicrobiae bacterium]|nr:aspartyl protease family protein [Verrucomicrobiae bacterium]
MRLFTGRRRSPPQTHNVPSDLSAYVQYPFLSEKAYLLWIIASAALLFVAAPQALKADQRIAQEQVAALYARQDWFGLRASLTASSPALYRAAVAAAFLRPEAEQLLSEIINASPNSTEARDAYRWLSHLFVETGQYRKLASNMQKHVRSFPQDEEALTNQKALGPLLEMPDQITVTAEPSSVAHDGGLFIPVRINDREAHFFVDTGGGFSATSQSEATRLGLRFAKASGTANTSTSQKAAYRLAVASELIIGGFRLHDVTFAVFPDEGEPWRDLARGRRGLIGLPVQIALGRMRWSKQGTFSFGANTGDSKLVEPNLAMVDDRPGVLVGIQGREVLFSLDTGAVNTDIYAEFGRAFPDIVSRAKKTRTEVRGTGGAETHDAVEVPDLAVLLGGTRATLRSASMLMTQINSARFVGNLGCDILEQHGLFIVDFASMRVEINEPEVKHMETLR